MIQLKNILNKCISYYKDYRKKVPSTAGVCFSYYTILSIIPVCSITAFLTNVFDFDTEGIKVLMSRYLTPDFVEIAMKALTPKSLSMTTIMTLGISLMVVSRGFNQLHKVFENMFPVQKERTVFMKEAVMLFKTVSIFLLILSMFSISIVFPVTRFLFVEKKDYLLQAIFIYIIVFMILFVLYKIIPTAKMKTISTAKGSAVASFAIIIIFAILSIYFSKVDYTNVYGPLAAVVMVMFSMTISAEAIYLGIYVIYRTSNKKEIQ